MWNNFALFFAAKAHFAHSGAEKMSILTRTYSAFCILMLVCAFCLSGCAGLDLERAIGVGPDDNAVLCVRADLDPAWSESRASYSRIELPKDTEVSPEQLAALVAACAQR